MQQLSIYLFWLVTALDLLSKGQEFMKASSQMAVYSFLLLSKIHVNSVLKFPVALMSE